MTEMLTVLEIVKRTTEFLAGKGLESARLNAELIVGHALGLKRMQLYLQFERPLAEADLEKIRPLVRRRAQREPLQYILGETEFFGLKLKTDRRALIPRPETEYLVEQLTVRLAAAPPARVLDLGTGTGAIALASREKLDNLIWIWSVDRDAPDAAKYFPKRHKPDIVGTDMYETDANTPKFVAAKSNLTKLGGTAAFAVTETGQAPGAKVLDEINPAYVLLWGDHLNVNWTWNGDCPLCNKPEQVAAFMKLPRIVTLDEMPAALKTTIAKHTINPHPLHKANPVCPAKLH